MLKNIIIGIDVGSSNIKTDFYDGNLKNIASSEKEHEILLPKPGWAEYRQADFWDGVKFTINDCLKKADISSDKIAAIGISGLAGCTVPVGKDDSFVYNIIPWSDQRAQEEVDYLSDNFRDELYSLSGNIPTILNTIPHLLWLKKHLPKIYKKVYKFTEPSGYIAMKLTGEYTMDWTLASSLTFGFDTSSLSFDKDIIKAMGLDYDKYPKLHDNAKSIGGISAQASKETGIPEGVPVYVGGSDVIAAALAAGAIYPGQGYYSVGSASNMMVITDKDIRSPKLISFLHIISPHIKCLDGAQSSVGFSLKWFRDRFGEAEEEASRRQGGTVSAFELMTAQGQKIKPGSGGVIYLPYLFGKFHPVLNSRAQGVFFGLTASTTKAHMIRAIMEGATYNMYETVKSAEEVGIELDEILANGGPIKSPLWSQIISDVTGKPLVTVDSSSTLGDAILAGVGEGMFSSFEEVVKKYIKKDKTYNPNMENHKLYGELFEVYKNVYDSLLGDFDSIAGIREKYGLV